MSLLSLLSSLWSLLWWGCLSPQRLVSVGSSRGPACVRPLWLRPWFRPVLWLAGRLSGSRFAAVASFGSWLLGLLAPWLVASAARWAAWGVSVCSSAVSPLPAGCPCPRLSSLRVWRSWCASASPAALAALGLGSAFFRRLLLFESLFPHLSPVFLPQGEERSAGLRPRCGGTKDALKQCLHGFLRSSHYSGESSPIAAKSERRKNRLRRRFLTAAGLDFRRFAICERRNPLQKNEKEKRT